MNENRRTCSFSSAFSALVIGALSARFWVLGFDRLMTDVFFFLLCTDELVFPSAPHFLWITEFPLFSRNDGDKEFLTRGRRWSSTHHPFAAPMYEDLPAFYAGDYGRVRGQHYDLVLNGVEIGGGSVRIHDPAMQEYVFQHILQVSRHPPVVLLLISIVPAYIRSGSHDPGVRYPLEFRCTCAGRASISPVNALGEV